jgi:DNA-binding response OmpR family regulator
MTAKLLSPTAELAEAPVPAGTAPLQRVLVADDEPFICRLNAEVLMDSGYHVDVATDGAAAWDALQLNHYDLLIADRDMPKVSGVDLLKKLHLARICVPVIMATETFPSEELKRYPWLPIEALLFKPYTITELLETVRAFIARPPCATAQFNAPVNWQLQPPAARLQF